MGPHFLRIFCVFFDDFRLDSIQNHTSPCMPIMFQCLFKLIFKVRAKVNQKSSSFVFVAVCPYPSKFYVCCFEPIFVENMCIYVYIVVEPNKRCCPRSILIQ